MRRLFSILLALILLAGSACMAEGGAETPTASLDVSAEPTVEPTAEPTVEPTAEPTVEPTAEPTPSPADNQTAEPSASAPPESAGSPAPTNVTTQDPGLDLPGSVAPTDGMAEEIPSPEPSVLPTPNPGDEAWMTLDGVVLVSGYLKDVLDQYNAEATVYILSEEPVLAMDYTTELVKDYVFLPDPEKYEANKFRVVLSDEAPEGIVQPDEEHDYLYTWVEEIIEPTQTPEPTAEPTKEPAELEIRV